MTVCNYNHEEIVYDGYDCPLCTLIKEHEATTDAIQDTVTLQHYRINDLESEVAYLTDLLRTNCPELCI